MFPPHGLLAAACVLAVCAHRLEAQPEGDRSAASTSVAAAIGMRWSARADETISPATYVGHGPVATLELRRARRRGESTLALRAAHGTLAPDVATFGASERVAEASLHLTQRWALGADARGAAPLAVGVELQAAAMGTTHRFASADVPTATYRFGYATLGPSARWERRLGIGAASLALGAPLVGVVDHPYSAVRAQSAGWRPRLASLGALREVHGRAAYTFDPTRRAAPVVAYEASLLRYDDLQPVRVHRQALLAGVVVRLGRGTR